MIWLQPGSHSDNCSLLHYFFCEIPLIPRISEKVITNPQLLTKGKMLQKCNYNFFLHIPQWVKHGKFHYIFPIFIEQKHWDQMLQSFHNMVTYNPCEIINFSIFGKMICSYYNGILAYCEFLRKVDSYMGRAIIN